MTNKRYTDEEIVKALECCLCDNSECLQCQNKEVCKIECDEVVTKTLDLIARKVLETERLKAEIERLQSANDEKFRQWDMLAEKTKQHYANLYEEAKDILKAEAYKECIEKVRKLAVGMHPCSDELRVFDSDLDNLLKMVGEIK